MKTTDQCAEEFVAHEKRKQLVKDVSEFCQWRNKNMNDAREEINKNYKKVKELQNKYNNNITELKVENVEVVNRDKIMIKEPKECESSTSELNNYILVDHILIQLLEKAAIKAQRNTHCPYSMYPVGCAILSEEGHMYIGSNVENASYPQSICAESNAIGAMVVAGDKKISKLYITSPNGGPPCGGCLQKILEFVDDPKTVEIYSIAGKRQGAGADKWMLSDLLPHTFNKKELQDHVSESQKRSPVYIPTVFGPVDPDITTTQFTKSSSYTIKDK